MTDYEVLEAARVEALGRAQTLLTRDRLSPKERDELKAANRDLKFFGNAVGLLDRETHETEALDRAGAARKERRNDLQERRRREMVRRGWAAPGSPYKSWFRFYVPWVR